MKTWDIETGKCLSVVDCGDQVSDIVDILHESDPSQSNLLCSTNRGIFLWNILSETLIYTIESGKYSPFYCDIQSNRLFVALEGSNKVQIWELKEGKLIKESIVTEFLAIEEVTVFYLLSQLSCIVTCCITLFSSIRWWLLTTVC